MLSAEAIILQMILSLIQSNPAKTDNKRALAIVHIYGLSRLSGFNLKENVRASFPRGESKLSLIVRCPYLYAGVCKAGFD